MGFHTFNGNIVTSLERLSLEDFREGTFTFSADEFVFFGGLDMRGKEGVRCIEALLD